MNSFFNFIELLSMTGLAQSVLILVYILFRVRNWRQASLAIAYFLVLFFAFGLSFSLRLEEYEGLIRLALWFCWALGPPLCYLLVLQVVKGVDMPAARHFWVLGLAPASLGIGFMMRDMGMLTWLYWLGSMSGSIVMLALWAHKDIFNTLRKEKNGKERYWLVMILIAANLVVISVNFLRSAGSLTGDDADSLLVVLGLAFLYLATTLLFRVYPLLVQLSDAPTRFKAPELSAEEKRIAEKVKILMEVDKLYHEPTFCRADLAREINTSENVLSRVINVSFGKSFPRLLIEFRVEDAKRMLKNKGIPIQVVASEVGFNSLASFNRAFRDVTGKTPTQYRALN